MNRVRVLVQAGGAFWASTQLKAFSDKYHPFFDRVGCSADRSHRDLKDRALSAQASPAFHLHLAHYQKNQKIPITYFQDQSKVMIAHTTEKITRAVSNQEDLKQFFEDLCIELGKARNQIAVIQESENADLFGIIRNEDLYTGLQSRSYRDYGIVFAETLMQKHRQDSTWTTDNTKEWLTGFSSNLQRVNEVPRSQSLLECFILWLLEIPQFNVDVNMEVVFSTGKETYRLSRYVILETKSIPIELRSDFPNGIVTIHHTEVSEFKRMKEIMAETFVSCLDPTLRNQEQSLKEKVGVFRYVFAHACPYTRGSASISEWLEQAIYRHQGYELIDYRIPSADNTIDRPTGDLDALTSLSLSEFMEKYQNRVVLLRSQELKAEEFPFFPWYYL